MAKIKVGDLVRERIPLTSLHAEGGVPDLQRFAVVLSIKETTFLGSPVDVAGVCWVDGDRQRVYCNNLKKVER